GGQPAPDRTGLVHISRAVEKHHAGIHREPPFPRFAGACRTDDAARPPGRAGRTLTPLQLREGALAEPEGRTVRLIHRICRAMSYRSKRPARAGGAHASTVTRGPDRGEES